MSTQHSAPAHSYMYILDRLLTRIGTNDLYSLNLRFGQWMNETNEKSQHNKYGTPNAIGKLYRWIGFYYQFSGVFTLSSKWIWTEKNSRRLRPIILTVFFRSPMSSGLWFFFFKKQTTFFHIGLAKNKGNSRFISGVFSLFALIQIYWEIEWIVYKMAT